MMNSDLLISTVCFRGPDESLDNLSEDEEINGETASEEGRHLALCLSLCLSLCFSL